MALCVFAPRARAAEMTRDQKLEWFMAQPENRAILALDVSDEEKTRLVIELPMNRRTLGSDLETYAPGLISGYSSLGQGASSPRPGKSVKRRVTRTTGGARSGAKAVSAQQAEAAVSGPAAETPAGAPIEGGGAAMGGSGLTRGSGVPSLPAGGPIAGGGPVVRDPKEEERAAEAYAGLMARAPYIGTKDAPCRYGPTLGRCTHEGKVIPPPPGPPSSFEVKDIGTMPHFPNSSHLAFPLLNRKWALRFTARPITPFPVVLDSPNGFVARSAMEIFMAISEKPGDFDVKAECLIVPDMLANGWGGGAAHSVAKLEVGVGASKEARCHLTPGRTYYLNIAGDCSDYYSSGVELANARAAGCYTDLVEVNGWTRFLTPGGPAQWCAARGRALGPDGANCAP